MSYSPARGRWIATYGSKRQKSFKTPEEAAFQRRKWEEEEGIPVVAKPGRKRALVAGAGVRFDGRRGWVAQAGRREKSGFKTEAEARAQRELWEREVLVPEIVKTEK